MPKKEINRKKIIVAVSGGMDPLHIGHVRMFKRAKELGDELVVILNNDNWLKKKKGHVFMPENEKKELLESIKWVDRVVLTKHAKHLKSPKDMGVSRELRELKPDIFANGGDRNEADAANPRSSLYWDITTCKALGIRMVFNIGEGGKVQSSSWLLNNFKKILGDNGGDNKKRLS